YGSVTDRVASVADEARDGRLRVECSITPDPASLIPLQHGLPGAVEVEGARVSPATLVLHAVGKRLGVLPGAPTTGDRGGGLPCPAVGQAAVGLRPKWCRPRQWTAVQPRLNVSLKALASP